MVKNLLFGIVLLVSVNVISQQDKKWSVEANYTLIPASGLFGNDNIIELGLKYRFLDFEFMKVGLSVNGGYFIGEESVPFADEQSNTYILQPRIFSEFNLPFSNKLKPSLGLGYSIVSVSSPSDITPGGFNFNFGLTYDISDKWFIQAQYDFIDLKSVNSGEGFNNIRIGTGFRF